MPGERAWPRPSEAAAELIQAAARRLLADPDRAFASVDDAVFGAVPASVTAEPALTEAMRVSTRANLAHWVLANAANPGTHVPANVSAETLDIARDAVRRGLDVTAFDTYRTGQNMAWRLWMAALFELSDDPAVLREALDLTARSAFAFVDETLAGIAEQIERERGQLVQGSHAERLELINLILEGAPIPAERAGARLGWNLDRRHTAAVAWAGGGSSAALLQRAADALALVAGAARALTVAASTSSIWVWVAGERPPSSDELERAIEPLDGVRVALGLERAGIEGFRQSHIEALATQALMLRRHAGPRAASYAEVQLAVLAAGDEDRALEFAGRTLGALAGADPELRRTLRTYIRAQFSVSGAARVLATHRNTVLGRLTRARELLPAPLEGNGLEVGLALEIAEWLGDPAGRP